VADFRQSLAAIASLPLRKKVRVLNLCGDQERVISLSDMRRALPRQVELVSGPGCAASICPEADVHQALRLLARHELTLLVAENLLRLPLNKAGSGPISLFAAMQDGADVRPAASPVEALIAAQQQPERDMVYFVAGFETLLVPLAGMILDGLPANLSVLLCGRRTEPLVDQVLAANADDFDALLLPGNRCALTGTRDWDQLTFKYRKPAAVAGYSSNNILSALHAVLLQHTRGAARVDNLYRSLVRPEGNAMARDQLDRVFEQVDSDWRGVGQVGGTGFRLRNAYNNVNADRRYPDYREELRPYQSRMPAGCECADVVLGRKAPAECPQFSRHCTPLSPYGPCMASEDGTCFLHRNSRSLA